MVEILNSHSRAPDLLSATSHCLSLPLLFDSPSALEGVKMVYRLQGPPFSSCLIKLHPTKLQLKRIRKKN